MAESHVHHLGSVAAPTAPPLVAPGRGVECDDDRDDDMAHVIADEGTGLTLCGLVLGSDYEDYGEEVEADCVVCAAMEEAGL
jgi:hypothetical protein